MEEIKQIWKCKKCNAQDRTDAKNDGSDNDRIILCWRCGTQLDKYKVIKIDYKNDGGLRLP